MSVWNLRRYQNFSSLTQTNILCWSLWIARIPPYKRCPWNLTTQNLQGLRCRDMVYSYGSLHVGYGEHLISVIPCLFVLSWLSYIVFATVFTTSFWAQKYWCKPTLKKNTKWAQRKISFCKVHKWEISNQIKLLGNVGRNVSSLSRILFVWPPTGSVGVYIFYLSLQYHETLL
jgi:hypothetical protein